MDEESLPVSKTNPSSCALTTRFYLLKVLDTVTIPSHSYVKLSLPTGELSLVQKLACCIILHFKSTHTPTPTIPRLHTYSSTTLFLSPPLCRKLLWAVYTYVLQFCTSNSLLNPLQSDILIHHSHWNHFSWSPTNSILTNPLINSRSSSYSTSWAEFVQWWLLPWKCFLQ